MKQNKKEIECILCGNVFIKGDNAFKHADHYMCEDCIIENSYYYCPYCSPEAEEVVIGE